MSYRAAVLVLTSSILLGLGINSAATGPILPELSANNNIPLIQAGLIFSMIFLGSIPSGLAAGVISDRVGRVPVLLFGVLLQVVTTVGITLSRSLPVVLGFGLLAGVGGGAVMVCTNVLVADLSKERSVSALNLVNVFFGIGAIAGPALAALSLRLWNTGLPAIWVGSLVMCSQVPFILLLNRHAQSRPRPEPPPTSHKEGVASVGGGSGLTPRGGSMALLLALPIVWILGMSLFFDVGTEQTLAGWIAVYMHESTALTLADAALVASGYWIAFTLGRMAGAGVGSRRPPGTVLAAGLSIAAAGILVVNLGAGRLLPSVFGFLVTGIGLGPVWPTIVAMIGHESSGSAGAAVGVASAVGGAGGVLFPWLEGVLMGRFGPAAGVRMYLVTLLGTALLVVAAGLSARSTRRRALKQP